MDAKLQVFLDNLGFNAHPFLEAVAEQEQNLPQYFVAVPYFYSLLGEPKKAKNPVPAIYFAARGRGKTALAIMIEYLLTETDRYGPVLVVNFNRDDFDSLLEKVERNSALLTHKHYEAQLIYKLRLALKTQQKRLRRFGEVRELNLPAAELGLKDLSYYLQEAGVVATYFLLDGLDELVETVDNPDNGATVVIPLLNQLSLLTTPGVFFKFFFPLEIKNALDNTGKFRSDRFQIFDEGWQWEQKELAELLKTRLIFFSGGKVPSLAPFSEVPDLDVQMCQAAQGSPRNLVRLGNFLLDQHIQERASQISRQALQYAILRLKRSIEAEKGYTSSPPEAENNNYLIQTEAPNHKPVPPLTLLGKDVFLGAERVETSPTGMELKLLQILYKNRGRTCSKEDLIKEIYNGEAASDQQLAAIVKRVREKLNKDGSTNQTYIKTVHREGFRLINYAEPDLNSET